MLRDEHGFRIGQAEAHDALRAVDLLGVTDAGRFRSALRLVCCATYEQTIVFEPAFDRFFAVTSRGVPQNSYRPRHDRPGRERPPDTGRDCSQRSPRDEPDTGNAPAAAKRHETAVELPDDAAAWQALRARYSPAAAGAQAALLRADALPAMMVAARRVIDSVRLGRSRRWKTVSTGGRFDVRRTIRASLQTGGDPVALRFLGHPRRNPRFVVLVDGSRSMADQTAAIIAFSRALCRCSLRAHVFVFSTELRDVTGELGAPRTADQTRTPLGQAWGGGTKIGENLTAFVSVHGARCLTSETIVMIWSDGLDAGDPPQLARALRAIDRRSAGIVWLNPHAAAAGYLPSAQGMRTALPFITILAAADDARGFERLARRLAQNDRIRGRRR